MKWLGKHIVDLIAHFRSDVYLDKTSSGSRSNLLGLDSSGKIVTARHTNIKVLPHHFLQNDEGGVNKSILYDDSGTIGVKASSADGELYAFVDIPTGSTVTNVTVYGSDTANVVNIYRANVNSSGLHDGTPGGGCVVGTLCDCDDILSDSTNYLVIKVTVTATSDIVYGALVTIM